MDEMTCCICGKKINPRRNWWTITETWEDEYFDDFARHAHMSCLEMAMELGKHKKVAMRAATEKRKEAQDAR